MRTWASGTLAGGRTRQTLIRGVLGLVLIGGLVWGLPVRQPGEDGGHHGAHHDAHAPHLDAFERAGIVELTAGQRGPAFRLASFTGGHASLDTWRDKLVVLNFWATWCTPCTVEMPTLEALSREYRDRGLVVIGFPSNQFGAQDPGSNDEIASFCEMNYGVTFPMMAKVTTKGPEASPVYKTLTDETPDGIRGPIKWNFTKFLVDRTGTVIARFESKVDPMDPVVTTMVEKTLGAR